MMVSRPSRVVLLSSTMATLIIKIRTPRAESTKQYAGANCIAIGDFDAESDLGGAGVTDHVIKGLLKGEKNTVAQFGIKRAFGKMFGNLQPASDACQVQKALGKQRVITGQ